MTPDIPLALCAIAACLLGAAFFASSETAITAVSRARIYHLILEGNRRAKLVGDLRKQKERMLGGMMIGNILFNTLGAAIATDVAVRHLGPNGVVYATFAMTTVLVIFAELLPKIYAIQNAEVTSLWLAPAIAFILKLLTPFTFALDFIIHGMLRLLGVKSGKQISDASDVIRGTIELHHHEGQVVKQDRDMLGGILDLSEIEVGEIMEHRLRMETIDLELPPEQIVAQAIASLHSRIPLWQGEPDNIVGILQVKSLIQHLRESGGKLGPDTIRRIMVKPWFVPETTPIKRQLHAFRARRQHLALVVDEYGALKGLVTLEDIIEVIVGRIDDEHDSHSASEIVSAGENAWFVQGTVTIRDLNRDLGWELPDEAASTIAGLVLHEAQDIPEVGDRFTFHGITFTILDKQGNQLTRIKMEKPPAAAPEQTE